MILCNGCSKTGTHILTIYAKAIGLSQVGGTLIKRHPKATLKTTSIKLIKDIMAHDNGHFMHCHVSYTNNLHKIIKECDFVITRSGASTINELVFLETPFLAIPYPFAKDDHQFYNAKYYVKKNLGWLIRENEITRNFLYKFIINLIKNKKLLSRKKKNMREFQKQNDWYYNSKKINNFILK